MSGTPTPGDLGRLEARLQAAGAAAAWPTTPDLRSAVVARIAAGGEPVAAPSGTRATTPATPATPPARPRIRLARALVLALLALVVLATVASALGYRLPGLEILFVDRVPTASAGVGPAVDRAEILLGSPVPIADARAGAGPTVLLPEALPAPATAWVVGSGADRIVTVAWAAGEGQPDIADSDGLALVMTAAPGRIERSFLQKSLGPGSTIEPARVGADVGWWIDGARHELFILDPDGEVEPMVSRLAGDVLVFEREGTVYRLESALGREATLAIAATLR